MSSAEDREDLSAFDEPPITPDEEALASHLQEALHDFEQRVAPLNVPGNGRSLSDAGSVLSIAGKLLQAGQRLRSLAFSPDCGSPHDGLERTIPTPFPDEFRFIRLLGEGSFGEVWLAEDLKLAREVAIKTIRAKSDDGSTLDALRNEATLLGSLAHPNVVPIFSWRESHNSPFLVMKLVRGVSLDKRVKSEGPLHWQDAAQYVADVGDGLLHLHARDIVHRDIKPSNILWDEERNEACITDLGISARLDRQAGVAGSLPFMAPEVFNGLVGPENDVYSLGCTLFWLLTAQVPFSAKGTNDRIDQIRRGLSDSDPRCSTIPGELSVLIRRALAFDAAERIRLRVFVESLRTCLNKLLADSIATVCLGPRRSPLTVSVSRKTSSGMFQEVQATSRKVLGAARNMQKLPPAPEQVSLQTGDHVRIDVSTDIDGYITVFNIGPSGGLNLLHPEQLVDQADKLEKLAAKQPLRVCDVQMVPPAGTERVFAVWTQSPLPLCESDLATLSTFRSTNVRRAYHATRDMKRIQGTLEALSPEEWSAVVLELQHAQSTNGDGNS